MLQLMCSVPCLEGAKRVHLTKGAKQSDKGAKHCQVCLQPIFRILVPMNTTHVGRILGQCGTVVERVVADDTGVGQAHGGFFINTVTWSWGSVRDLLVVRHGR